MAGTLFVVATPIGNLEDLTFRAVKVLRSVKVIAAEDTRRTARLLQHYGITTSTVSLHGHNEYQKVPQLVKRLAAGDDIAIVTDAGTPGISDPGRLLVRAAHQAAIRVTVVPGPSAVIAALVASGFPTDSFIFAGFPPYRAKARKDWLERLGSDRHRTLVLFEAPHRIKETLRAALEVWGDREVALARELTKVHEELVIGPISVVLERLGTPRGEYTVAVAPSPEEDTAGRIAASDEQCWTEFGRLTEHLGLSRREAITAIAEKYQLAPRLVYAAIERAKAMGQSTDSPVSGRS